MEKRTAERENPFFFFCFSELLSRWNGTTEADLLFQKGMEKVQKYEGAESMPRGILILKRIKYLIMIQRQDTFLEMQKVIFQILQKIEHY